MDARFDFFEANAVAHSARLRQKPFRTEVPDATGEPNGNDIVEHRRGDALPGHLRAALHVGLICAENVSGDVGKARLVDVQRSRICIGQIHTSSLTVALHAHVVRATPCFSQLFGPLKLGGFGTDPDAQILPMRPDGYGRVTRNLLQQRAGFVMIARGVNTRFAGFDANALARAQRSNRAKTSGSILASCAKARPMPSANAQMRELAWVAVCKHLRMSGSKAMAKSVPDKGHPCLMPGGSAHVATSPPANTMAV